MSGKELQFNKLTFLNRILERKSLQHFGKIFFGEKEE